MPRCEFGQLPLFTSKHQIVVNRPADREAPAAVKQVRTGKVTGRLADGDRHWYPKRVTSNSSILDRPTSKDAP